MWAGRDPADGSSFYLGKIASNRLENFPIHYFCRTSKISISQKLNGGLSLIMNPLPQVYDNTLATN
jgi:hypothetical protein